MVIELPSNVFKLNVSVEIYKKLAQQDFLQTFALYHDNRRNRSQNQRINANDHDHIPCSNTKNAISTQFPNVKPFMDNSECFLSILF